MATREGRAALFLQMLMLGVDQAAEIVAGHPGASETSNPRVNAPRTSN